MIKNIDEISKSQDLTDNLKDYRKYQNSFVIFDAESNFEHIYPGCLTHHLGAPHVLTPFLSNFIS